MVHACPALGEKCTGYVLRDDSTVQDQDAFILACIQPARGRET